MAKRYNPEPILSNTTRTCLRTSSPVARLTRNVACYNGRLCDGSGVPCWTRSRPTTRGSRSRPLRKDLGIEDLVRLSANESPLGPRRGSSRRSAARRRARISIPTAARLALASRAGRAARRAGRLARGRQWGGRVARADRARRATTRATRSSFPTPHSSRMARRPRSPARRVVASPLQGYETDLEDMQRRVTPRTKAVIVCTPHNPASTIVPRADARATLSARWAASRRS